MKEYLTRTQWCAIERGLPGQLRSRLGNQTGPYRRFIEGVLWVAMHNAHWTQMPGEYGAARTHYVRFLRWTFAGHWNAVADALGRDSPLAQALLSRCDEHRRQRLRRSRREQG